MTFDIDAAISQHFVRSHSDGEGCDPVISAMKGLREEAEAVENYRERAAHLDGRDKEMNLDLAREEAVHLGEHAQRLSELDPDLSQAVQEGMEEARTSAPDKVVERVKKSASFARADDDSPEEGSEVDEILNDDDDSDNLDANGEAKESQDGDGFNWGKNGEIIPVMSGDDRTSKRTAAMVDNKQYADMGVPRRGQTTRVHQDALKGIRGAFDTLGKLLGPEFIPALEKAVGGGDLKETRDVIMGLLRARVPEMKVKEKESTEDFYNKTDRKRELDKAIRLRDETYYDTVKEMKKDWKDWEEQVEDAKNFGDESDWVRALSERPPDPKSRPQTIGKMVEERDHLQIPEMQDFPESELIHNLRTVKGLNGRYFDKEYLERLVENNPNIATLIKRLNDKGVKDFVSMSKDMGQQKAREVKGEKNRTAFVKKIVDTYKWLKSEEEWAAAAPQRREAREKERAAAREKRLKKEKEKRKDALVEAIHDKFGDRAPEVLKALKGARDWDMGALDYGYNRYHYGPMPNRISRKDGMENSDIKRYIREKREKFNKDLFMDRLMGDGVIKPKEEIYEVPDDLFDRLIEKEKMGIPTNLNGYISGHRGLNGEALQDTESGKQIKFTDLMKNEDLRKKREQAYSDARTYFEEGIRNPIKRTIDKDRAGLEELFLGWLDRALTESELAALNNKPKSARFDPALLKQIISERGDALNDLGLKRMSSDGSWTPVPEEELAVVAREIFSQLRDRNLNDEKKAADERMKEIQENAAGEAYNIMEARKAYDKVKGEGMAQAILNKIARMSGGLDKQEAERVKAAKDAGIPEELLKFFKSEQKSDIDARIRQWQTSMNCRL